MNFSISDLKAGTGVIQWEAVVVVVVYKFYRISLGKETKTLQ